MGNLHIATDPGGDLDEASVDIWLDVEDDPGTGLIIGTGPTIQEATVSALVTLDTARVRLLDLNQMIVRGVIPRSKLNP